MKTRFLDTRNCHILLPAGNGLPLMARLEDSLREINDLPGELHGSIDALVRQNETTINVTHGSRRLCNSAIEITQDSNLATRVVHVQAAARRFPGPARFHALLGYENGMSRKTIVPLQFLLKAWGDPSRGYQCYIHTISHKLGHIRTFDELMARQMSDTDSYYYVGITSRNWLQRLDEHVREMRQGNERLFYRAWRERYGTADVHFSSYLRDLNLSYQEAMDWEEEYVDKIAADQFKLNMIPGGFKGLRLLHEHRIIDRTDISLQERDAAVAEYARRFPRKGIPHPFMSERWKDDEFYLKNIEAKKKNLSAAQVRKIRELAGTGRSAKEIAREVEARNEAQVKNVISGRYYGRIK